MKLYKFTCTREISVPGYENLGDTSPAGYLNGKIILSNQDEISYEDKKFILNKEDGRFYLSQDTTNRMKLFERSEVATASVVPKCVLGLSVFDKKENGEQLTTLNVDDTVYLNLTFANDSKDNIWTSVTYYDEKGLYENGQVIYKNYRNNFANLYIPDSPYPTVLTAGEVDKKKLEEIRSLPVVSKRARVMKAASRAIGVGTINGGSTTTTVKVSKSGLKASKKKAVVTKEMKEAKKIAKLVARNDPSIVQNSKGFPPLKSKKKNSKGAYEYDYSLNYSESFSDFSKLYERENYDVHSIRKNFTNITTHYNRFKLANPEETLSRGFVHIFFTRPDLNVFTEAGKVTAQADADPFFNYVYKNKPGLAEQLVLHNGEPHDFMWLLSNKAGSFQINDENLEVGDYGKTFQGHSIQFARTNERSKIGGTFDISYTDGRDLEILMLHKLWIQYASNVYHGRWIPRNKYMWKRILDYACSVYVIITAEDFETILYWAKYYGVFPINVPYSALSWSEGSILAKPSYNITYQYSWSDIFNPIGLTEFNINTFRELHPTSVLYIPTYNPEVGHIADTWVGAPFVETIQFGSEMDKTNGSKVEMKLRFASGSNPYANGK